MVLALRQAKNGFCHKADGQFSHSVKTAAESSSTSLGCAGEGL